MEESDPESDSVCKTQGETTRNEPTVTDARTCHSGQYMGMEITRTKLYCNITFKRQAGRYRIVTSLLRDKQGDTVL